MIRCLACAASADDMMQVLGDLLRVRTLVRQHAAKHDESRTQEYLYAATRGDTSQVQQVRTHRLVLWFTQCLTVQTAVCRNWKDSFPTFVFSCLWLHCVIPSVAGLYLLWQSQP